MSTGRIDFDELNRAAAGRWGEILPPLTSLPSEVLTKRSEDHPCPKCNGSSVIWPDDRDGGAHQHGRIACRTCTDNRPTGDGISTVAAFAGIGQAEAAKLVADHLGLPGGKAVKREPVDIIAAVAKEKRMPLEAFKQFEPVAAKRGRNKEDAARVPVYNEAGEKHSHFDFVPGHKGYCARGKGNSGLFLPGRLPVAGETWHMVEGCKDAAALVGLGFNAVGLPGNCMGEKYARLFSGVHVVIVPDLDEAGQAGAQKTGGRLRHIAASVRVARLPGEVVQKTGDDVRDVLSRANGEQLVRDAIDSAEPWQPREGEIDPEDGRPEETLTLAYAWHVDNTIRYLGRLGWESPWLPKAKRERAKLYQRGGVLVHVVTEPDLSAGGADVPRIRALPMPQLALRIADACQLVQEKEDDGEIEKIAVPPPRWLIEGIYTRGEYGREVRPLSGIITVPTIRPAGSIVQVAGYDEKTGLIYKPTATFPAVPDKPTLEDAKRAAAEVLEVVADVPFVGDADRSGWLAMLLTMIGRPAIEGPAPLFGLTANAPGTGKSLAADAANMITTGRPAARKSYVRCDDEMRKQITAVAIEALPSVLLDNVDGAIGGAAMDAALTSTTWSDRILGSSRTTGELPLRPVWIATGNNLRFAADAARRVLPIRLESPVERPEDRTDFEHPNLLGWVRENRPRLAVAALTILRAYFVAGCPVQSGGVWGSYESWSAIVRGAIVWMGLADPLDTRAEARDADESTGLLRMLITGLQELDPDGEGVTAREIENAVSSRPDEHTTCPSLREAVAMLCGSRVNARSVGRFLNARKKRPVDGYHIVDLSGAGGIKRWTVQKRGGESGFSGDSGFAVGGLPTRVVCVSHTDTQKSDTQGPNGELGFGNSPNPLNPLGDCSEGHDEIEQPTGDGRIKTTCRRCGKYIGARPAGVK